MDFNELKQRAIKKKNEVMDNAAKKLAASKKTIHKKEQLDKVIAKSKTTSFKNKETGIEKQFKHRTIVIFAEENSDFFKDALYMLPVIATKAFTQNVVVKLAQSNIPWVELSDYQINNSELPGLVVFEEEKVLKTIHGKENILKLVKNFNLNINTLIDEA